MRALFLLLALALPLRAQTMATPAAVTDSVSMWSGLPSGIIAVTYCVYGGQRSLVDVALLGTDSLPEILAHEAEHREQYRRQMAPCSGKTTLGVLLNAELDAWCATRALRMERKRISKAEADKELLGRLYNNFSPTIEPTVIATRYAERCP